MLPSGLLVDIPGTAPSPPIQQPVLVTQATEKSKVAPGCLRGLAPPSNSHGEVQSSS